MKEFWRRYKKNRAAVVGAGLVVFFTFLSLFAPIIAPYDPSAYLFSTYLPPSWDHLFGTDNVGRDVLSRVIHGSIVSLTVGFFAAIISALVGLGIGALSGYFGGKIDEILMRGTEIMQMIPRFFLLLIMVAAFGSGIVNIILIIGLLSWPGTARLVRGEFLALKEMPFIEAARSLGFNSFKIIFSEILPNALPPAIVASTLQVGDAILLEASLSFLGLGDPGAISWGQLLGRAQRNIWRSWHIAIFSGAAIFFTVLGINLLGDGLIDALNPRLKER
jgi:peptide/nickel transport system permease protein